MLHHLYSWYGKRVVWGVFFVVAVLVVASIFVSLEGDAEVPEQESEATGVRVMRVSEFTAGANIELIGDVESISEADVRSKGTGRITAVRVTLGSSVASGQILAELENASERAAVLQAEGAYEAALAGAAQSNIGVSEARTSLTNARTNGVTTYRSAFTTVDGIVSNLIDEFYANADSGIIGFRLEGPTREVNDRRLALRGALAEWQDGISTITPDATLAELQKAHEYTIAVAELLDIFASVVSDEDNENRILSGTTMEAYQTQVANARTAVNNTLQSIESAQNAITGAQEALSRIELSGTDADVSSANAQVKQALGSLRAAQARLADTIFRSPISGTVNDLSVRAGDFVSPNQTIATIANNNAFMVTTYIQASDRDRVSIGDAVLIEDEFSGTVTRVAPAVNQATKKIKVEIQTDSAALASGETVRLTIESDREVADTTDIQIPVSALKVETDRVVVFTVSENSELLAHEVTEGPLIGGNIIIKSGVTSDMVIVRDARGLNEGDQVEIIE